MVSTKRTYRKIGNIRIKHPQSPPHGAIIEMRSRREPQPVIPDLLKQDERDGSRDFYLRFTGK